MFVLLSAKHQFVPAPKLSSLKVEPSLVEFHVLVAFFLLGRYVGNDDKSFLSPKMKSFLPEHRWRF